ncbi:MAG: GNAT family N-acetyltransferase [Candidatus Wallbacteria bacterium]|nr:GNAT family N-acetyltransferase [Candidatus Wallbacteria bacterium]
MSLIKKRFDFEKTVTQWRIHKRNERNREICLQVIRLDQKWSLKILKIQEQAVKILEDRNIFQPDSAEFIRSWFRENHGFVIGAIDGNKLVAYFAVFFPGNDPGNLGIDLGVGTADLKKIAQLESAVVIPAYRGNGLGLKLMRLAMKYSNVPDRCMTAALCSPANLQSLRAMFACGLKIRALVDKFSGKQRYIFFRDKREKLLTERPGVVLSSINLTEQKKLLASGYCGFKPGNAGGIEFRKFRTSGKKEAPGTGRNRAAEPRRT